jgi:hypothetical protein
VYTGSSFSDISIGTYLTSPIEIPPWWLSPHQQRRIQHTTKWPSASPASWSIGKSLLPSQCQWHSLQHQVRYRVSWALAFTLGSLNGCRPPACDFSIMDEETPNAPSIYQMVFSSAC